MTLVRKRLAGAPRGVLGAALAIAALVATETAAVAAPAADQGWQVAARRGSELPGDPGARVDEVVLRIQRALAAANLYDGPVDGRMSPETEKAIRTYQRRAGIPMDGMATEALAAQLETGPKVQDLLRRLERAREDTVEAARQALLNNPQTRGLVTADKDEIADPTRDPTPCFQEPSPQCLLGEALESAKAIFKPEMRDWALGEILVAQANAGFGEKAIETVRRIQDPRLIMVALRDIARAEASAGRGSQALAAAEIIPDGFKQLEAYAAIADIQAGRGSNASEAVDRLLAIAGDLDDPVKRVAFLARAAVILSRSGDAEGAERNVAKAETVARSEALRPSRETALRHVAAALAEMERPAQALAVLKDVEDDSDRIPVLVSAATAQARAGDARQALATAEGIEAVRYRSVVLARIAVAQAEAGDRAAALATVDTARRAARSIKFPYARSYAISRIALALAEIGALGAKGPNGEFDRAVTTAGDIEDNRLRAHVLWSIAAERRRAGDMAGAGRTESKARKATAEVKSALSRVWMFGEIAASHAAAQEADFAWAAFARGLEEASHIENAWGRARALTKMAATLTVLPAR